MEQHVQAAGIVDADADKGRVITVRMSSECHEKLMQAARDAKTSMNKFALLCLTKGMLDPIAIGRDVMFNELIVKGFSEQEARKKVLAKFPKEPDAKAVTQASSSKQPLDELREWNEKAARGVSFPLTDTPRLASGFHQDG